MPLYDYRCPACSHEFEQRSTIARRLTAECPQCSGVAKQAFSLNGDFFISAFAHPGRRSGDEIVAGRHFHGEAFVDKHDPHEPLRVEARADAERQVERGDRIRAEARTRFDNEVTYLDGPVLADAKETMEQSLTRSGVRR